MEAILDFYSGDRGAQPDAAQRSGGWGMQKNLMKYQGIGYYLFLKTKNLL
jgi:hypothetical protein